eukprot:1674578-Lingulodinium_polyedra.AAC.1
MRSDMHSVVATLRFSQIARSMRRPPCGGRRVERARCEMCGTAATECISECICEQLPRASCS